MTIFLIVLGVGVAAAIFYVGKHSSILNEVVSDIHILASELDSLKNRVESYLGLNSTSSSSPPSSASGSAKESTTSTTK
jgi:hypothetical protein